MVDAKDLKKIEAYTLNQMLQANSYPGLRFRSSRVTLFAGITIEFNVPVVPVKYETMLLAVIKSRFCDLKGELVTRTRTDLVCHQRGKYPRYHTERQQQSQKRSILRRSELQDKSPAHNQVVLSSRRGDIERRTAGVEVAELRPKC